MIGEAEILRRARALGLQPSHVRQDYVLNHLLAAVADRAVDGLVFRGGTALARVFWPDFRLSEDLDFIMEGPTGPAVTMLEDAVDEVGQRTGISLQMVSLPTRNGRARAVARWAEGEVLLDIQGNERPSLPAPVRSVDLAYSDLQDAERRIPVLDLPEILGNKVFMLADRREPRDLYDLWYALSGAQVAFSEVARGHIAKYGYPPGEHEILDARRAEPLWQTRLGHQASNLVPFDEALGTVLASFRVWEEKEGH